MKLNYFLCVLTFIARNMSVFYNSIFFFLFHFSLSKASGFLHFTNRYPVINTEHESFISHPRWLLFVICMLIDICLSQLSHLHIMWTLCVDTVWFWLVRKKTARNAHHWTGGTTCLTLYVALLNASIIDAYFFTTVGSELDLFQNLRHLLFASCAPYTFRLLLLPRL